MKSETKIALSDEELELVNNTGIILTKRNIIDKVYLLLGNLAAMCETILHADKNKFPEQLLTASPKISRGENYLQLPYVVLDYPRLYGKDDILAVRTMFWWGNFFSITLHISGSYKNMFQQNIIDNISLLQQHNFYICINADQWQHHFEEDNYITLKTINAAALQQVVMQQRFIKLAVKFSLQQWQQLPGALEQSFSIITGLIKT
jgi:hypothetical protein